MPLYRGSRRLILQRRASGFTGPSFAYAGSQTGSIATNTVTYTAVPIGTAGPNRFVAVMVFNVLNNVAPTIASATFTTNGSAATITRVGATTANSGVVIDCITVLAPTGTTDTLTVVYNTTPNSGTPQAAAFTTDNTTLFSQTPAVGFNQVTASTSQTATVNVAKANSAVLSAYFGLGITNGTQNYTTPNDSSVVRDSTFSSAMWGHANGAAVNASSQVSASWTTAGTGNLGIAVFF